MGTNGMHVRTRSESDRQLRAQPSAPGTPRPNPAAYRRLVKAFGKKQADRFVEMLRERANESRLSVSDFERVGTAIGQLVKEKNAAYGDSFAQSCHILAVLYPDGVRRDQYRDMLGIVRVIDKLFRIATRKDAFGESPWRDVAGYGVVGAVADERQKPARKPPIVTFSRKRKRHGRS